MKKTITLLLIIGIILTIGCQSDSKIKRTSKGKKVRKELPYARIGNVVYAEVGEKKLLLDIYKPKNETGLTPVVIWIHGGGWTQGTKSGGIPFAKMLTPHGISVVSIDYRLYPEATSMLDEIHDCKAAIRWVKANAENYNLDAGRIAVAGDSAGGHLASFMGLTGGESKVTKNNTTVDIEGNVGGNTDFDTKIKAFINYYGPAYFDPDMEDSHDLYNIIGEGEGFADRAYLYSPQSFIDKNDPSTLLVWGDSDTIVPLEKFGTPLYENIKALYEPQGKYVNLHIVEGGRHAGSGFWSGECAEVVIAFLKKEFKL